MKTLLSGSLILFVAVMTPSSSSASTIPCVQSTVEALEFTSCSIGALVYTFGNASVSNTVGLNQGIAGFSADSIILNT